MEFSRFENLLSDFFTTSGQQLPPGQTGKLGPVVLEKLKSSTEAESGAGEPDKLLAVLERSLSFYVRKSDVCATFIDVLPDVIEMTRSEFGFLAEVCYGFGGDPYLQSHAVSNAYAGWPGGDVVSGLQFLNLDTLNGAIMTTSKPVISNDPPNDPRSGGLPSGHYDLRSYIGLPFHFDGSLVGALALANRDGGYDEAMVEFLEPMSLLFGLLIETDRRKST